MRLGKTDSRNLLWEFGGSRGAAGFHGCPVKGSYLKQGSTSPAKERVVPDTPAAVVGPPIQEQKGKPVSISVATVQPACFSETAGPGPLGHYRSRE